MKLPQRACFRDFVLDRGFLYVYKKLENERMHMVCKKYSELNNLPKRNHILESYSKEEPSAFEFFIDFSKSNVSIYVKLVFRYRICSANEISMTVPSSSWVSVILVVITRQRTSNERSFERTWNVCRRAVNARSRRVVRNGPNRRRGERERKREKEGTAPRNAARFLIRL